MEDVLKKIATLVAGAVAGVKAPAAPLGGPLETRDDLARRVSGSKIPTYAKRQALKQIGYRLRKYARCDVDAVARQILGPGARYTERPDPDSQKPGGGPEMVFGVVEAEGYHRLVNRFERYAPGEGRRRMVAQLCNPAVIQEMKK